MEKMMEMENKPQSVKRNLNALIIHPNIEPYVIDNAMLTRCLLCYGPSEEAGRLYAEEGVHVEEVEEVRLEAQHILRIDHLWVLKNLTRLSLAHNLIEKIENLERLEHLNELDLSFNKIEKIENLEKLVKLEILTLFHNKIRKLENMDELERLLVFSIGDNLIEDYKEMTYMRRFRFLRTVSFKGNPCCDDPMTYYFLKTALPKVTYIDYKLVTEEEREEGRSYFRSIIRQLDVEDEQKEKERVAREEYQARVEFYALSFVEYMSGPELVESMFAKDPDGSLLLEIGGELTEAYEVYKANYVETMEELVEWAQQAYSDRQKEIKLFKDLVLGALEASVEESKRAVKEFEEKKKPLKAAMNDQIEKYTAATNKQPVLEQAEPIITTLTETFNELLYELWKKLMTIEMNLFEQCEESRVQFSVNMTEMITKLLEVARNAFGCWREYETNWTLKQFEVLNGLLGNKVMLGDVSPETLEVMMDKELMSNAVAASSDNHLRFIDAREDLLTSRANTWKNEVVDGCNDNEIKRNRDRVLEINFFIDNQREEWNDLQNQMQEPLDPEAAALLGDDF